MRESGILKQRRKNFYSVSVFGLEGRVGGTGGER